jgi:hypothetical protein
MDVFDARLRFLCVGLAMVATGVLLALIPMRAEAATAGDLCLYGRDASSDTGIQMQAGTSPAIAGLSTGGAEVAFQTSGGQLATYADTTASESTTTYGMDPKSSPAISTNGAGVFVAMTASSNDELYIGNGSSMAGTGQQIAAGTSPSVAANSASSAYYAFQNDNSDLVEGDGSTWDNTGTGEQSNTSPSIADVTGSGWETASQVNTGAMWEVGQASDDDTGQGMAAQSSPSIAGLSTSGDFQIAFEANNDDLYIWGSDGNANTAASMAAGTNPSITPIGDNGYDIAYQGSNGDLWLYGSDGSMDTGHAMASGTSPAITATSAGYEVAYQCTPPAAPPPPVTTTVVVTTTVRATTPAPTRSKTKKVQAQFTLDLTWNGTTSHLSKVTSLKRLPAGALVTFTCRAETVGDSCPRLGVLPKRKRTLAKELAVVADRTFTKNNLLTITVAAKRYATEVFTIKLTGQKPLITRRWRS